MKKAVYIRCPRCELNYIEKKDKLCSVCKAELSANKEEFIGDLDLELCPICKTNYIQPDEIMCSTCLKDHQSDDDVNTDWENYLNRDEEEVVYDDEETGDMASVTNIDDMDDEILDDEDLDTSIGFDDKLDDVDDGLDLDDEDEDDEFSDKDSDDEFDDDDLDDEFDDDLENTDEEDEDDDF